MGENKIDQQVENTNADQQQIYGSPHEGRHNREGASALTDQGQVEKTKNPSMHQQYGLNTEEPSNQPGEEDSFDYEKNEDPMAQNRLSERSQMYELQDEGSIARVEGDDKDILGETENSTRNQQRLKGGSNQGNTQNR